MAIPFLNNINLSDNELQNAKLHITGTAPTAATSQIYYDSSLNVARYYDNDGWVRITDTSLTNGTFISATLGGTNAEKNYTVELSATGTPSASTFLRGDNTWATVVQENDYLTGLSFNTTNGVLTATVQNQPNVTVDLDGRYLTGNQTITLTGDVTGSGATSISTTVANGVLDVANFNASAVVTEAEGIENNDNDTTIPTSAAVKDYVDSAVVGGLVYQGGYNASTNTPDLDSSPSASIKKGWTYTVTADGLFFTEQVRVGDVIISEVDAPTTLADWTTVQNNIDLASASQIGIGNVAAGTGIGVSYSGGTATVTNNDRGSLQNIFKNVAVSGQSTVVADNNNDTLTLAAGSNISITTNASTDTVTISNTYVAPTVSYATTITDSSTVTHNLGTKDVIIQLYDIVTNETVYADVSRPTTNTSTIAFASTPTNSIRVLVQKIG